jgi:hypothetical protein
MTQNTYRIESLEFWFTTVITVGAWGSVVVKALRY